MSGTLSLSLNQWQNSQDPLQFMSYSQATCFHEDRLQNEHATTILEVVTHSDPSGLQYRNPWKPREFTFTFEHLPKKKCTWLCNFVSEVGNCDVRVWFSEVWPGRKEEGRHCGIADESENRNISCWGAYNVNNSVSPCALHPPPKHRFSAATMGDLWPAAIHHCLHLGCSPDEPARSPGSALADTSTR